MNSILSSPVFWGGWLQCKMERMQWWHRRKRDVSLSFEKKENQASYHFSCRILTIQINMLVTSTCGTPGFGSCSVAAVIWPWTSQWAGDSLNFLICKIGKVGGDGFWEYNNTTLVAVDRQIPSRLINLRGGERPYNCHKHEPTVKIMWNQLHINCITLVMDPFVLRQCRTQISQVRRKNICLPHTSNLSLSTTYYISSCCLHD